MPKIFNNVTDLIGKTPLVRLPRLTNGLAADVIAKRQRQGADWIQHAAGYRGTVSEYDTVRRPVAASTH